MVIARALLIRSFAPQLALQCLAGLLIFAVQVIEEVEVRILRDLGMRLQKACQFRVVTVHVICVREQRRVARHHLSQCRTHAQQLQQLILERGDILFAHRDWIGSRRLRHMRWLRRMRRLRRAESSE